MARPPFETLIAEHGPAVLRLLRGLVGPDEADDCFQETVVAALRAYPRLADDGNLRGWLLTIAQRKGLDAHRARGRRAVPVATVPERAGGHEPALRDGHLWAAVRALPPKQRAAIALRFACDLSHRETAAVLGCSEEAARRSVHEGLRKLEGEVTR